MAKGLRSLPLLAQGSVFAIEPSKDSPRARTRYMWTRKVKAKTVTKALSREQYEALKAAIEANRQVEGALQKMRDISQTSILESLADSPGKGNRKKHP